MVSGLTNGDLKRIKRFVRRSRYRRRPEDPCPDGADDERSGDGDPDDTPITWINDG